MRTARRIGILCAALLVSSAIVSAHADAQGTPVSRRKNSELDSVWLNQGSYDSPPVETPRAFSVPGYDQCLVALGATYCRPLHGHWDAVAR